MSKRPIPDLSRPEIESLIDLWIFSERDRAVLKRRLLDGIVFEKLGEEFLTFKAKDNGTWAKRYEEMAHQELQHAAYLHDRVVEEIEELRKTYTPPQEMLDKWDADHKKYIEKAAWIKQMLSM